MYDAHFYLQALWLSTLVFGHLMGGGPAGTTQGIKKGGKEGAYVFTTELPF